MKYFLLVGEPSGDLHAASLVEALRARCATAQFYGLGGDKMQAAGVTLFQHYRKMAFMGILAVLRHLPDVKRNFRIAEQALLQTQPDVLILIDYPSFNLRIAAFAKKHLPQTKIVYYIPPKVWAWKTHRIHRIAQLCDEVLGIFPFEPDFYARYGYTCTYVGNPTNNEITAAQTHITTADEQHIVLLPGSRMSEIKHCLPTMLAAARNIKNQQTRDLSLVIAAAPSVSDDCYRPYLQEGERITHDTYRALSTAQAAIVNSGTATLETALIGCPQVAVYHVTASRWLGWIKPLLFKIPYFTLPNIIANKQVIYEAVGAQFTQSNIERELTRLLDDKHYRQQMMDNYHDIQTLLGNQDAAATAAEHIYRLTQTA